MYEQYKNGNFAECLKGKGPSLGFHIRHLLDFSYYKVTEPCLPSFKHPSGRGMHPLIMETKNDLLLNETQHRLLMCCRMAKSLGQGDIFLDATTHKMCWHIEREGHPDKIFHSLDEMEEYLEHLLMNRQRMSCNGLGNMDRTVKRRMNVIKIRERNRTTGEPMVFFSKIQGNVWKRERNAITAGR